MEATWRGSTLGLIERCGSFGGLITAGKDIFLLGVAGEPPERTEENVSKKENGNVCALLIIIVFGKQFCFPSINHADIFHTRKCNVRACVGCSGVRRDSVKVSQHAQHQDFYTEVPKWNSVITHQFYTCDYPVNTSKPSSVKQNNGRRGRNKCRLCYRASFCSPINHCDGCARLIIFTQDEP